MAGERFSSRVLVVEDDTANLEILQTTLEAEGFDVRTAKDGFEALVVLRGALPEVLVSDLELPRMSGFELLSVVRRRFPQIGVIAVSGDFRVDNHPGVLADAFVPKPFRAKEILDAVAKVIKADSIQAQRTRTEAASIWIPRQPAGYYVITCTECLRSFPISPDLHSAVGERSVDCLHCGVKLRYFVGTTNMPD